MDAILDSLVPIAEWTFLTSAKATVVIGLVLLSQKIFNRWLSARGRYALWFAVVACLAVPFNVESPWSVFSPHSVYLALESYVSLPGMDVQHPSGPQSPLLIVNNRYDITSPRDTLLPTIEVGVPSALAPSHSVPWYVALWVVVGMGLTCLTFYNQIRYLRLRAAARDVDETTRSLLRRCREDMGLRRRIHVLETRAVTSPSVFGCIAPTLLLPEGLQHELCERDLRHVFLHELAHVKRHDVLLNWLTMCLQILHWFNPVIWYGFSRMRSDREQACDASVLERLLEVEWREYGNTLINLTDSFPTSAGLAHGVGIVESQKRMKARLQMIGRFRLFTARHALVPALLLVLLVAVALTKSSAQEDIHAVSTFQTVVGVGPAWKVLKREVGSSYAGTVSHHTMEGAYPTVLSWSNPGDTFVFMFAFDLPRQRPPAEYDDLLPRPWAEIERRVKQGETLELTGEARGLHVVLLAAPTMGELDGLVRTTALLDKVRHASHDTGDNDQSVSSVRTVVGVGPAWKTLKREVGSLYSGTVSHHSMEDAYPKVLSWSNPGDTFVFMFAFDAHQQRPPEEYHDMLPRPWAEIERRVKQGETLELTGEARGLHVVLLAAPRNHELEELIRSTALLDDVRRTAHQESPLAAMDIALASDALKLRPYDEGGLYSAVVAIRNGGNRETPSFGVHFVLTRGEDRKTKTMTHGAGPILPDDHWNEMTMPFALMEGINDIAVIVDPDDAVSETNETNNRASLRVVVKGGRIVESSNPLS